MKKHVLLTPGPTPVPPQVLLSMAQPIIHHRTPQFEEIFAQMSENLKYLFQTRNDVITFASSGTGAMEASVVNLLSPGDKAICVQGGKFGERWAELCRAYGVEAVIIDVEWGDAVSAEEIERVLNKHPDAKVVFTTLSETSTGVATDVKAIGAMMNNKPAVLVTDAISGLGGMELKTDEWGVDVVVSGSQKGLMIPPGLAFCSISPKAWELVEKARCPRYYFDFRKAKKNLDKNTTAFTPAITLCIGLNEALKMIREETLEKAIARHARLAEAVRGAIQAIGLELFAKKPANVVTAVKSPENIDSGKIVKMMRDDYGISIAGGQGDAKGKIFRIAQLGYMNEFDILTGLSCLEIVLARLGYKFEMGKAIGFAETKFQETSS